MPVSPLSSQLPAQAVVKGGRPRARAPAGPVLVPGSRGAISVLPTQCVRRENAEEEVLGVRKTGGHVPQPIQDRLIDTNAEFLFGTVISARFSGRGISLVDRADDVLGLLLDGLRGTSGEQQDGAHRGTVGR